MKLYQALYYNKNTNAFEAVSMELFDSKEVALDFGKFTASRHQRVEVLEVNKEESK